MTRTAPKPPPGIDARPAPTLTDAARAAADLIDDAARAGLPAPTSLDIHAFDDTPDATMHLYRRTPAIWHALSAWADRYRSRITTRPGPGPGRLHAAVQFQRGGVRFEISTIISAAGTEDENDDSDSDGSGGSS